MKKNYLAPLLVLFSIGLTNISAAEKPTTIPYQSAQWDPIHFSPRIETATNDECLKCHQEILNRKVRLKSPAGVPSDAVLAWYQTLGTYEGQQETFHRRHLVTPYAKKLMNMQCNTCHQGNDPREEAHNPPDHNNTQFTLRKQVNVEFCVACHGDSPYSIMGLPLPWEQSKGMFQNNCLLCHGGIRTNRHQVNYLNADAIEEAGKNDSDVCFGCHGGRQWYRIAYPYPRHSWEGMAKEIPEWAKDRPTESEPRFRIKQQKTASK